MTAAPVRLALLVTLALLAFAGNSLLTRAALAGGEIGPDSFAAIRLSAGAITLLAIGIRKRLMVAPGKRDIPGIMALFIYAAAFSRAYVSLSAATGALILFTCVQMTVISGGIIGGVRMAPHQGVGVLIALGGLAWLLAPGLAAPAVGAAALMAAAGVAWGIYTLLGRGKGDPVARTARNFIGTFPLAVMLLTLPEAHGTAMPIALALASGAITSALGYVVWYSVLPRMSALSAASLQLLVPVITSLGSVIWLYEPLTTALAGASIIILAGIALTLRPPFAGSQKGRFTNLP
ncbi:MAG: DMT family transporter [Sphingomonadaceae bacterium]